MDNVLTKKVKTLQAGDVIFIDRLLYRHYGVYAGKGRVIHYIGELGHFGGSIGIRETSLEEFANGKEFTVVKFKGTNQYSGQETVRRARSRIGEESYNLLFNNCEHFALWCKTGESKSKQVEQAVSVAVVLGAIAVATGIDKLSDEG